MTGTDTGVGKTEVACALLRSARAMGHVAAGMKPVAAGVHGTGRRRVNADVEALAAASALRLPRRLVNPYLLAPPIAPHLAATEAGVALRVEVLLAAYRELVRRTEVVVVEGAGGFLVPLNDRADMGSLAARMRLPVVLVVGMRLGCLSHALLTREAIERRGLALAGWVANRIDPHMRRHRDNVASLCTRMRAPLLAEVGFEPSKPARARALDAALDHRILARWLA